jgi:hypothetical protein
MANDDDIELLQQLIAYGGTQAFELVPLAIKKVILEKQWQKCSDKSGKKFTSFEAFVRDSGWHGLNTTIDDLRAYCRKFPDIDRLILEAMEPGREHGGLTKEELASGPDNVRSAKYGNSAIYTLKRLKRDRPDLFQQVLGGMLSANAAAIEAGFRGRPDAYRDIIKRLRKLTDEQLHRLRAEIGEEIDAEIDRRLLEGR